MSSNNIIAIDPSFIEIFVRFLSVPLVVVFVLCALRAVVVFFIGLPVSFFIIKDKRATDGILELFMKSFRVPQIYWMALFDILSISYFSYFTNALLYVLIPLGFLSGIMFVDIPWQDIGKRFEMSFRKKRKKRK